MVHESPADRRAGRLAASFLGLLLLATACENPDRMGPTAELEAGGETAMPAAVVHTGIVFASTKLTPSQLNTVHTGMDYTPTPSNILSFLSQVRAKNGRVLLTLAGGERMYKNADGTFNLTKWKAGVDRYRSINISSYIADGTIAVTS